VSYTVGGTATNGTDYTTLPGTITFPAGAATVDLPVNPTDDTLVEGTETVVVTPTAAAGYTVSGGSAQIALFDNDTAPTPVGVEGTANATEPSTPGNFRFTRTGDTTAALTVSYTVGGTAVAGTDYA